MFLRFLSGECVFVDATPEQEDITKVFRVQIGLAENTRWCVRPERNK